MAPELEFRQGEKRVRWKVPEGISTVGGGAGDHLCIPSLVPRFLSLHQQGGLLKLRGCAPLSIDGNPFPPHVHRLWVEEEVLALPGGETLQLLPREVENRGTAALVKGILQQPHLARSEDELVCMTGADAGKCLALLGERYNVGRGTEADFQIRDRSISRLHARLERTESGWWLVDLDTPNGILLDGSRVSGRAALPPGSFVQLGQTLFRRVCRQEQVPEKPESPPSVPPPASPGPPAPPLADAPPATEPTSRRVMGGLAVLGALVGIGLILFSVL